MRDLYRRIGLRGRVDDPEAIRRALARGGHDARDREAVEAILLHPRRKAVYDRHRAVLVCIGELRANLGLADRPAWVRGEYRDFDSRPTLGSQLERLRWPQPDDEPAGWTAHAAELLRVVVPVVAVAIVAVVVLYAIAR